MDQEFKFKSVNKILEKSFKEHWDLQALSNYQGVTLCYRDVARRIAKIHIAFEQLGVKPGDKIAICGRNQANWGVAFMAALTYGAVAVPLLHEFKPANIHYLVNHSEARVLFSDVSVWENINVEEMPGLDVVVRLDNLKFFYARTPEIQAIREHLNENYGKRYPEDFDPDDLNYVEDKPEELAVINYTSGSSGFSKGVMIPYRAIYSNLDFARNYALPQMTAETQVVSMLPTAHMYGLAFEFLYPMSIGAHVHFLTRLPSPKVITDAFAAIKPDYIISVPLIIEKIYKSKLKPVIDKNKIFFKVPILNKAIGKKIRDELYKTFGGREYEVIIGGAAFNPDVEKFFKDINFPYTVGYGMTECAPIIAYDGWETNKLYSCGKVAPYMQIRVDSSDPQHVPGELQVKGPNVMLGYYKNEEATKASFTDDGWFKTGDIGIVDSDGYIFIKGRSKCMILGPSGQNIYPEEIEAVINSLTYVVDSLVIDDHGQLVALVYPDYHQGALDGMGKEELMEHLKACLPEVNKQIPVYSRVAKMEFMPEDFERTPKKSIKRYLYERK
jgi:long-chain acyl-CoA synthetase